MTTYRLDIDTDDLGEYDGTFLAHLAEQAARLLGETGAVGFVLHAARRRDDEGWQ